MASSNPLAVKQSGKSWNKRLIQPVIPVLPNITVTRRKNEISAHQADLAANGFTQETSGDESRRAPTAASLDLQNGVHKDEIQEAPEKSPPAQTEDSSAASSPVLQNVPIAIDSFSESQVVPSALPEQSPFASIPTSQPKATKAQASTPPSTTPDTNGFNFSSTLSQTRLPRAREHYILFRGPSESPSPSRTTSCSLREQSISTPPADLLQLAAPEPGTISRQERQTPVTTDSLRQQLESAELPEQSQSHPPPDSHPAPAAAQLGSTPEPARPSSTLSSMKLSSLSDRHDDFQVQPNLEPDNGQIHAMGNLNLIRGSTETQAGTQNGFCEQESRPVQEYGDGNQPNGNVHSAQNSFLSIAPEYRLLPSDPEEYAEPTVSEHLSRLFITKEWADWSIQVSSPVTHLEPVGYLAHGIFMARSPILRQEMRDKVQSHHMERVIVISPDWYIQPQSFEAVLRYLYTESLLTKLEVQHMFCITSLENGKSAREYQSAVILSYWMAGLILGLRPVADQAAGIAHEIMDWDVLELTLQHALMLEERALDSTAERSTTQPHTPGSSKAGSASAASLQNTLRSPFSAPSEYFFPTPNLESQSGYRYPTINAMISKKMKKIVYEFISQHVDMSSFETEDQSITILKSYLPETREYSNSSRYKSNPALAAIRFGSMPVTEEEMTPTRTPSEISRTPGQVASAILLNLGYADLSDFCRVLKNTVKTRPGYGSHHDWIQKIIAEREKRRRIVLSSKTISNQERLSKEQTWNVVGWEEYIEATDDLVAGWELCRKWTGFTIPARQ